MNNLLFGLHVLLVLHCSGEKRQEPLINHSGEFHLTEEHNDSIIIPDGRTIKTRILPPKDFVRMSVEPNSFAAFLRDLPLKPHGSKVLFYDGTVKNNGRIYCAVIDRDLTNKDLQQCADALIRLRAEFLYGLKAYEKIHFNFTSGDTAHFITYAEGYRPILSENRVTWQKAAEKDYSYSNFQQYLEMVFMYAGSYSLEKELIRVEDIQNMQIGDIFIQGGFPGHAVMVVDMVVNRTTGEKKFMLVQSYMPAQDIQVLVNPEKSDTNPWYQLNNSLHLITPEWVFRKNDLKRFVKD